LDHTAGGDQNGDQETQPIPAWVGGCVHSITTPVDKM